MVAAARPVRTSRAVLGHRFVTLSADRMNDADDSSGTDWNDWARGGYRGPSPARRGVRPAYLALSLALLAGLLIVFALAASGRLP